MMNTNMMHDPNYQLQMAHRLSHGGKFRVVFGSYPDAPDVFEYITPPDASGARVRYINTDARPGAKISRLIQG